MIDYIIEELKDNPLKTIAVVVGTIVTLIYFIHGTSLPPINNEIMNPVNNTNLPPMVVSLMSDMMNPQEAGTTIKWMATALDPEKDPIQYKFLLDGQQKTDWSYNSTWYWTTSSADIGSHMIVIKIKDGRHQVDGDDAKDIHFTISPDAITWYYKGNTLYYQGNYDDAIQAYEKAIELKPDLAIELKPDLAEAWNNEGHALKALKRTTDANAAFAKATELGYKPSVWDELLT